MKIKLLKHDLKAYKYDIANKGLLRSASIFSKNLSGHKQTNIVQIFSN